MRILKLEFENINSLKGKWTVDFTHPDYAKNHDIFVIHGPTGAGKTTLLDALTLALYGRTPRLETINSSEGGNELMTRGCSFCRAQVTYRCAEGVFISEFQQRRARGKSTGKLQAASFRICREDGSDVRTGVGSNLGKETQEIIQLDYKQFCRSMMLAQGEFSTFLKSKERERAEILEKLTGTERYRRIGENIAKKYSEIKQTYEQKKTEKETVEQILLEPAERLEIERQKKSLMQQLKQTDERLREIHADIKACDELEHLEKELHGAETEEAKVSEALVAFAEQEERLRQAQSAKNCEASYVALQDLRSAQRQDEAERGQLSHRIRDVVERYAKAEQQTLDACGRLEAEERLLAERRSVWKDVRELDVQISAAKDTVAAAVQQKERIESALRATQDGMQALKSALDGQEKDWMDLDAYLSRHKDDDVLREKLAEVEQLKKVAEESQRHIDAFEREKSDRIMQLKDIHKSLDDAQKELDSVEEAITAFISHDALFVARLLQRELSEGKPCPVCGSLYHAAHPASDDVDGTVPLDREKAHRLVAESGNLNAQREAALSRVRELSALQEKVRDACARAEENGAVEKQKQENALSQIHTGLERWCQNVTMQTLPSVVSELHARAGLWEQKKEKRQTLSVEVSSNRARMESYVETERRQREECDDAARLVSTATQTLDALVHKRGALFGTESVDAAEKAANKKVADLKAAAEHAEDVRNQTKENKARFEAKKEQLEHSLAERAPALHNAEHDFAEKTVAQGFDSEAAFVSARMEDSELSILRRQSENLKTRRTEVQAALAHARKAYEDYRKSAQVIRGVEELREEQAALSDKKERLDRERIEFTSRLMTDSHNQEHAARVRKDYADIQEQYALWKQMNEWAGVNKGADLSVFVQSLAFHSLLTLTNKNLYGITGRYKMKQKNAGSLDFEINDIYFEEPRSISNLSGGEQFLVSLSLALGISEFASRNVRVDSLFLDEGFGTLSGELLTEAINALKNLQKDGKMLGIITHVQDVINEIDQRIEVRPVSGGKSVLIGSGITHGA